MLADVEVPRPNREERRVVAEGKRICLSLLLQLDYLHRFRHHLRPELFSKMSAPDEGSAAGSSNVPKAVPSLAKKQNDVTRLGTQKMKFVPVLPARRKKE